MLRVLGAGLLWGVPGYVLGAALGALLVSRLTSNRHDRSQEAAVTGLLVGGPLCALAGFGYGVLHALGKV